MGVCHKSDLFFFPVYMISQRRTEVPDADASLHMNENNYLFDRFKQFHKKYI